MSKYVIGIDPDAKKHGVATYQDNELIRLDLMSLMELMTYITNLNECYCDFGEWTDIHIEDVASQNFMYAKHRTKKTAVNESITRRVGMCQQAQIEVERMIEHTIGLDRLTKHKPSKAWKDANGKKQFQKLTSWTGRSNEDTRSAAYFGYLGL